MHRIIPGMLCLLALCHFTRAQTGGQVIDASTKEPLYGVTVRLVRAGAGTASGPDGRFLLPAAAAGDTLVFTYIGYQAHRLPATAKAGLVLLQPVSGQLSQVVVSASREARQRSESPVAISVLPRQVLLDTKPASLDQVLNKVSGVYMVNLGNEQHTMAIRQPIGYKSLFLYLEDGLPIRTTGAFNHNALIEMNMAALKTIEVIRGPASSLYGSEAIGGAVNFITQAPAQVPTAKLQLETSNTGYRRTDFSASHTLGKVGLYAAGYYAARRRGPIQHSDFDKLALTLRADYALAANSKLVTTASLIDYQTDQTGGLDSTRFFGRQYGSLQTFTYRQVKALRLKSSLEHDWDARNRTRLTLFYRNNLIGQNPFYAIRNLAHDPLKAQGEINEDAFRSYGLVAQHRKAFSFLDARLIGGLSVDYSPATYQARLIDIDRDTTGKYTGYTHTGLLLTDYRVQLLNTAAYGQLELHPIGCLKAVAALRYDRLDYAFDNHLPPGAFSGAPDERNGFNRLTPKLGLTYGLQKNMGLYANYSIGFTPPQISELYRGVQVPSLQPAHYANYEAGGWISFAQTKGYLDLSAYQLDGTNEIISVRLADGSYVNRNAGKTRHRGLEYTFRYAPIESLHFRFSGTSARHSYVSYAERGGEYSGNEMATAPRFISNAELSYKPAFAKGLRLNLEWQHLGRYYLDAANTACYPGYELLNARLGYAFRGLEVWANALNITNQLYATTADKYAYGTSYRLGSPRTFHLGIGYSFSAKTK